MKSGAGNKIATRRDNASYRSQVSETTSTQLLEMVNQRVEEQFQKFASLMLDNMYRSLASLVEQLTAMKDAKQQRQSLHNSIGSFGCEIEEENSARSRAADTPPKRDTRQASGAESRGYDSQTKRGHTQEEQRAGKPVRHPGGSESDDSDAKRKRRNP